MLPSLDSHVFAQLTGPRIEAPVNVTLKFWYHMRGNSVGRLSLYRKALARPDQIIWEKTGHQSFSWTEAHVLLERGSFQVRIFSETLEGNVSAGRTNLFLAAL